MGQLLIRDLDDSVIQRLEHRAQANHTSAEEEARRALTVSAATAPPAFDADAWRRDARALAEQIGPLDGPTSTELLRADRYREGGR